MIGLVDNGRLVCLCLPCDVQHIVRTYLIYSSSGDFAGEAILTVLGYDGQTQDGIANLLGIVNLIHPTCSTTTMQAVLVVVDL